MQTELLQIKLCQLLSRHKGFTCYPQLQSWRAETLKHTGISQVPSADNSRVMGLSKVILCNFTILMPQLVNNTSVRQSCRFISATFVSLCSGFDASQEATLIPVGWDPYCICYKYEFFFPNISLLGAKNLLFHTYSWVLRTSTTFEQCTSCILNFVRFSGITRCF